MSRVPTSSQTVGPFFNFGLTANPRLGVITGDAAEGERLRLEIRVTDGDGSPTPGDCMIELWQADAAGRYAHPRDPRCAQAGFHGFGRLETDMNGCCVFEIVKPGRVAGPENSCQAPHVNVIVFARGLLQHLHTRIYFSGELSNAEDPVLALVPGERRATLLARPVDGDSASWRFDIRLQGAGETVFFDV